jgi:hypothetical protein
MMRLLFAWRRIFMNDLSIDWSTLAALGAAFGMVLLSASLAVRMLRVAAEKRREARWDRGLPAE